MSFIQAPVRFTKRRLALTTTLALVGASFCATQSHASPNPEVSRYGGVVKVGIFDTFPGFCVSNNPANSALMAERTIYETLFERTKGGDMVGLLASGAVASPDLKTWTITLRRGIKFTDGANFDATAVLANFNAITGRIAAAAYSAGGLPGYQTKAYTVGTGTAFTANIKAMTVKSSDVIEFTLDRAQNDFTSTLYASGRFFMRSPNQLANSTTCADVPIGTGPFKLVSWTSDQMVVTRNASYWRRDPISNAQLPYLNQITFTNVKEGSQRAAAVRKSALDAAMFSSATEGTFIKDLRNRRTSVNEVRSATEYYPSLWLNEGKPGSPFSYMSARQSVLSCVDRANYLKVRNKGEGAVATSLVGPKSVMFTKTGFQKFSIKNSKHFLAEYLKESGKARLEFTFPADTTSVSQGNAAFLKATWAKCGIYANYVVEETGVIITKAFNAAPKISAGEYYNAYDALVLLLFEGNDVAFNLPFIVTNSYPKNSSNPVHPLFENSVGVVLGLNHHSDTTVDTFFYDGEAATSKSVAQKNYRDGTAYLQSHAVMGSITHMYYTLFTTKKLAGIGTLQIEKGKTQRVATNWGIDWTGVWKKA
jgi:ABC-type transport system substrate-binding protein